MNFWCNYYPVANNSVLAIYLVEISLNTEPHRVGIVVLNYQKGSNQVNYQTPVTQSISTSKNDDKSMPGIRTNNVAIAY